MLCALNDSHTVASINSLLNITIILDQSVDEVITYPIIEHDLLSQSINTFFCIPSNFPALAP